MVRVDNKILSHCDRGISRVTVASWGLSRCLASDARERDYLYLTVPRMISTVIHVIAVITCAVALVIMCKAGVVFLLSVSLCVCLSVCMYVRYIFTACMPLHVRNIDAFT